MIKKKIWKGIHGARFFELRVWNDDLSCLDMIKNYLKQLDIIRTTEFI